MQILNAYKELEEKTAGPVEYSYKEVIEFVSNVTGTHRRASRHDWQDPGATHRSVLDHRQGDSAVSDNVLQVDEELLTFKDLDMQPSSIDKEAFDFLQRFRPGGHFTFG
eukprot:CAMPEP_0201102832 /NCGR_PEP_ID=MMETSP0812-20130820/21548_1 /ASSEMBLY_ACC=CAM_ASM_000668 /TAXON_ID=98059 /ORGANISM="Dinobryon sp., Strain UTEXLB2267" /LENGTH=108 /DNA_ID=CAMNT_0047360625 /DNA_START=145 /DNA_END=472 /DNA_ORIENTATION=+